jgi:uncharacterized oxidoreductase
LFFSTSFQSAKQVMSFWGSNSKHTVLITGGASGIGLALAARLVGAGHTVIVAGRRQTQLDIAKSEVPGLIGVQADVATEAGREALVNEVLEKYPAVNVLINNAAVAESFPHATDPANGKEIWELHKQHLAINLHAPLHLSYLFIPHFLAKSAAQIVIVTSGLAYIPLAKAATYSATKAAGHSLSQSLRHELKDTPISVIEILPPVVKTDMSSKAGMDAMSVPLDEYADDVIFKLVESDANTEITYQISEKMRVADLTGREQFFQILNSAPSSGH